MFGKKKQAKKDEQSTMGHMHVMPAAFYGGQDPGIYRKEEPQKQSTPSGALDREQRKSDTTKSNDEEPRQGVGQQSLAAVTLKQHKGSKRLVIVGVCVLFVGAVGVISWYYIRQATGEGGARLRSSFGSPQSSVKEAVGEEPIVDLPQDEGGQAEQNATTTDDLSQGDGLNNGSQEAGEKVVLEFSPLVFRSSVDLDADTLTDVEEEIFSVDSGTWDTDGDGYYDGQEVINLYNPKEGTPAKLINSGLVREYVHPQLHYRVYYPVVWQADAVDEEATHVLFNAITGEYIDVIVVEKTEVSFESWFAIHASSQRYTDLVPFQNKFGIHGFMRRDGLVGYFPSNASVAVIGYHLGERTQILYPRVMEMMIQSFRPRGEPSLLPEQEILSIPGTPTTSATSSTPTQQSVSE